MWSTLNLLVVLLAASLISNCSEEALNDLDLLEARLVAYDESDVERTSFEAGSDIRFALNLVNHSNKNIEAGSYYDYCVVYNEEEFLVVYKRESGIPGTWLPVGKAYDDSINCPAISIPMVVPAQSETTVCGLNWENNPINLPLGPGNYYTALSSRLTINNQSRNLNLRLDFEVR